MIFQIAKKVLFCFRCGGHILPSEHYLGIFFTKGIPGLKISVRKKLLFHVECYRDWYSDLITAKYNNWALGVPPSKRKLKSPRGRPRKYKSLTQANRLRALIHYYKKAGNNERVRELESSLQELSICSKK